MGHAIHKHMNSFKAKNLLSAMPIDNKASALEMDKGSAAYMKDEDFKGKKPDANKNGVPDYAEDGKGKS